MAPLLAAAGSAACRVLSTTPSPVGSPPPRMVCSSRRPNAQPISSRRCGSSCWDKGKARTLECASAHAAVRTTTNAAVIASARALRAGASLYFFKWGSSTPPTTSSTKTCFHEIRVVQSWAWLERGQVWLQLFPHTLSHFVCRRCRALMQRSPLHARCFVEPVGGRHKTGMAVLLPSSQAKRSST